MTLEAPQMTGDAYRLNVFPFQGAYAFAAAYQDASGAWRLKVDNEDDYPFPTDGAAPQIPCTSVTLFARWKDLVHQADEVRKITTK